MLINVHGVVAAYETNWLENAAVVEALVFEREGSGYLSGKTVLIRRPNCVPRKVIRLMLAKEG